MEQKVFMKKTILLVTCLLALGGMVIFFSNKQHTDEQIIGVIVPMEHEALTQIVNGLKKELGVETSKHITVKVMNAQGDPNIQRAIIEQLVRDQCNLLIPIGTAASQMTLSLAPDQNIICLAADFSLISSTTKAQATALCDELAVKDSISFLHAAFPHIKKLSLLYSTSEKVAKEIPLVIEAARSERIEVQKLMIHSLADLYTMSQAIAPDSEAIFILKDHLIVSGIQTIVQQAEKRHIPVMTSDEGSVISGAAFAIGVKEADIGRQGAQIAKTILQGTPPKNIPPQSINGPFPLFINRNACIKQGINLQAFIERVQNRGIPIHYVDNKVGS
jgi:putative tryptophan/tyrosine transport system substrate-binding protein